jgi:hypothetical protein
VVEAEIARRAVVDGDDDTDPLKLEDETRAPARLDWSS